MPWWRSDSPDLPTWLHFLRCYNFGLHWEHHKCVLCVWGGGGGKVQATRLGSTLQLCVRVAASRMQHPC